MRCALVLVVFVGCYRPNSEASCALTCNPQNASSDCPGELACNAQGRCSANGGTCAPESGTDGPAPDDGILPDDPPGLFCIGTAPIRPCFDAEPTNTLPITAGFNTDSSCPLVMELDGRSTCVIAAREITISNTPHFSGMRPLVIVGAFSITVATSAVLDLSSSGVRVGAGTQPSECVTPLPASSLDGAAGGSFASLGGKGGVGTGGVGGNDAAPVGGISFRGGCRGSSAVSGNPGGAGGGAVYLISNAIRFDGIVRATGAGGTGGISSGGGAGGGTGGYIGVDATTVIVGADGRLVASGGGGGSGGCMGLPGFGGSDADTAANISAPGGPGGSGRGPGGRGAHLLGQPASPGGDGIAASCAGGGGGGGVGRIEFFQTTQTCSNRCFPSEVKP